MATVDERTSSIRPMDQAGRGGNVGSRRPGVDIIMKGAFTSMQTLCPHNYLVGRLVNSFTYQLY